MNFPSRMELTFANDRTDPRNDLPPLPDYGDLEDAAYEDWKERDEQTA